MTAKRNRLFATTGRPWHVAPGLVLAAAALATGLCLPVMRIEKLVFWEDRYSVVQGALALLREGHPFLGVILLAFSVVFPIAKLVALSIIWFAPMSESRRARSVWWTAVLGKWSMLDVFVVATTIVLSQSSALGDVAPGIGLYVFGGAILLSMVLSLETERRAR